MLYCDRYKYELKYWSIRPWSKYRHDKKVEDI